MTIIRMQFKVSKDIEFEKTAELIQQNLDQLDIIKKVKATPETSRIVGVDDVLAGIAVTVLLIKGSRETVEELRKLIQATKGLITDIKDLQSVLFEVGKDTVSIDELEQLPDNEIQALIDSGELGA